MDELDDILSMETQGLHDPSEYTAPSSSKRKTNEDSKTSSGKKSRRTMSFGGARVKPDSLQLSVVGYDDDELQDRKTKSSSVKKSEHENKQAFDKVCI